MIGRRARSSDCAPPVLLVACRQRPLRRRPAGLRLARIVEDIPASEPKLEPRGENFGNPTHSVAAKRPSPGSLKAKTGH